MKRLEFQDALKIRPLTVQNALALDIENAESDSSDMQALFDKQINGKGDARMPLHLCKAGREN